MVRSDIVILTDDELATSLEELAGDLIDKAPRTAEALTEAGHRLRARK